jgi:hypothetical protein
LKTAYGDQGGDFSPNGIFYYVLDHGTESNSHWTGIHAFRTTAFPTNPSINNPIEVSAKEITLTGLDPYSPTLDFSNCPESCIWDENIGDYSCSRSDDGICVIQGNANAEFLHMAYEPCYCYSSVASIFAGNACSSADDGDGKCDLPLGYHSRGDELEGLDVFRNPEGSVSIILTILTINFSEDEIRFVKWTVNET